MTVDFKRISKVEFEGIPHRIFNDPMTDCCFAAIQLSGTLSSFAWRSHLLEPTVLEVGPDFVLLAIDEHVAILERSSGKCVLNLDVYLNFHEVLQIEDRLYVATELIVFEITGPVWKVIREHALPEYFESFEFVSGQVQVTCMDGTRVMLASIE